MKDFVRATRESIKNVHFCGTESATQWQGILYFITHDIFS